MTGAWPAQVVGNTIGKVATTAEGTPIGSRQPAAASPQPPASATAASKSARKHKAAASSH